LRHEVLLGEAAAANGELLKASTEIDDTRQRIRDRYAQ
jgi:hypothetical protein